jgi:hypothetical protein
MANPLITGIAGAQNVGPSSTSTVNTQTPYSFVQFIEPIFVTLTPVAVATITTAEQSFGLNGVSFVSAATGIKAGDIILGVSPPSTVAGVTLASFRADATTNDKFYITFANPTAGSVTPASGVYTITVMRLNLSNAATLPTALI